MFSLVAHMVKNLSALQETQVWSLGWEALEEDMAIHSSILAWWIPWTKEPGESHGQKSLVGYSPWGRKDSDTTEQLNTFFSLSPVAYGKSRRGLLEGVVALSLTGHLFLLSWSSWWIKGFYSVVLHHWPHPLFLSILSAYWLLPGTQGLEEWAVFTHK